METPLLTLGLIASGLTSGFSIWYAWTCRRALAAQVEGATAAWAECHAASQQKLAEQERACALLHARLLEIDGRFCSRTGTLNDAAEELDESVKELGETVKALTKSVKELGARADASDERFALQSVQLTSLCTRVSELAARVDGLAELDASAQSVAQLKKAEAEVLRAEIEAETPGRAPPRPPQTLSSSLMAILSG
jgi:hypothetical protein